MKQYILIGLFLSLSAFAVANSSIGEGSELKKEIKRTINYPEFAKKTKLHGVVMVHFVVNSDGSIEVKEINASDSDLGEYVKGQLERIEMIERNSEGAHFVKFRFRYVEM